MAIIGQAAGAASLPFFASLFGRRQFTEFAAAVNRSASRLIAFSLLGSAGMIALAQPAVDLVFRRGSFHATDASATATYFAIFAISLALWTAQAIYSRAFYAAGETFVPMVAGTIITAITIPVYWGLHLRFGVIGLAWASNTAILIHTVTLAILLHRRKLVPISGLEGAELIRALLAAIISGGTIQLLLWALPHGTGHLWDAILLVAGGLGWAALACGVMVFTGSKLPGQLLARSR